MLIDPIEQSLIRVFGMAGSFHVGPDVNQNQAIRVRYFNTVASGADSAAAGNSRKLLEELKPMRERVHVSALRDLSSLLQRELDDQRVAHELVPYLQGKKSKVGFFPGILVALVPKGFLEANETAKYPTASEPEEVGNDVVERYGDCWSLRRFKSGSVPISLGRLEIDPMKADLVVIDGQHRANAFRFVTDTFEAASGTTIYASFYPPSGNMGPFNSELPVTILWFEADGALDPKLLSRQLFVDVNLNAREVSESRNILLDDRDSSSIVVGSLYKIWAARGFETSAFSLLHGGFDCEEKEQHPLALLLPAHFRLALAYFAFGDDRYDDLRVSLKAEASRKQKNYSRATRLMMGVNENLFLAATLGDKSAVKTLGDALALDFAPALLKLLEGFSLVQAHVKASAAIEVEARADSSRLDEVWEKIFCGGEGLYGAFKRNEFPTPRTQNYMQAIQEIEDKFVALRTSQFSGVDSGIVRLAYRTFASKAGLTGFLMAAQYYCDASNEGWEARQDFMDTVAKLPKEAWANVFGRYKPDVVPQLDSKLWPDIRNIVLRVVQSLDSTQSFFRTDELEEVNPDGKFLSNLLAEKYKAFRNALPQAERPTRRPDVTTIGIWRDEAISSLKETLAACRLTPLVNDSVLEIYCINRIEKLIPKDASPASGGEALEDSEEDEDEDDEE